MTTLELEINCLCLFARDGDTFHVLMPAHSDHGVHRRSAQDHEHDGADEHWERHVVRMLHRSFTDQPAGRGMEGWALVLGTNTNAPTDPSLPVPEAGRPTGAPPFHLGMADVSEVTGMTLERSLIADEPHESVRSRITLYEGDVTSLHAEAEWMLKDRKLRMTHRVVWRIRDVPDELVWRNLGADDAPPILQLSELEREPYSSEEHPVYRVAIYHVPESALPPDEKGTLYPEEVMNHFAAFYTLFGVLQPQQEWLPTSDHDPKFGKLHCASASAVIASEQGG